MASEPDRCCFDEWASCYAKRARKRKVVGVSVPLLAGLQATGLWGRSVLDLGCAAGGLAMETLDRGATRATGIDLSAKAIEEARRIAAERGLAERATFEVGDGASRALEPHDVVVLDKVFCCYPDVEALLSNSLAAARSVYAYSLPASEGIRGRLNRILLGLGNAWYRLRESKFRGFRAFVHDVSAIEARVRQMGFSPVAVGTRRFVWRYAVFARN